MRLITPFRLRILNDYRIFSYLCGIMEILYEYLR